MYGNQPAYYGQPPGYGQPPPPGYSQPGQVIIVQQENEPTITNMAQIGHIS